MDTRIVALTVSAIALLGGCQTASEYHNNFGELAAVPADKAKFSIELPPGDAIFEQQKNSSTGSILENVKISGEDFFVFGRHTAIGQGYYLEFNYQDDKKLLESLDWNPVLQKTEFKDFNVAPDPASVKQLEGSHIWTAYLPGGKSKNAACMSGLFVDDKDADLVSQDYRRFSKGITDKIIVISCQEAISREDFEKKFNNMMQSIRINT